MDQVCTENTSVLEILPDGHSFASTTYLDMVLKLSVSQFSRCKMEIFLTTQGGSGNTFKCGETTQYYSGGEGFSNEEVLFHVSVFKGLGTLICTETTLCNLCSLFCENLLQGRNLLHLRIAYIIDVVELHIQTVLCFSVWASKYLSTYCGKCLFLS